tara:strand:- start:75890 stop:76144 length:255 start_codon:yes stop_codon:yes gene_type:complete
LGYSLVKKGDRVICIDMEGDPDPVPSGTEGTVKHVDDAGQIHMNWDNGRTLALIPGVDKYKIITEGKVSKNKVQKYDDFSKKFK